MTLVLLIMSKWVLLCSESSSDAEIWIFSCRLLCCRCLGHSVRRGRRLLLTLSQSSSLLGSHWKWWPKPLPFAKCEYFVAERNAALLDATFLPISLRGWKNGQECKWIIQILLHSKEPTKHSIFLILSISNLMSDAGVLSFHKRDTFKVFLIISLENVKHWFSF